MTMNSVAAGEPEAPRGTYPQPIPESAQVKPRTDQTRVRQRAIERTVFPSVRVASESPDRADHQGEPGLPGKSRSLADHLLPHVEGRCFYESLSAAKPRLQSDSRIEWSEDGDWSG